MPHAAGRGGAAAVTADEAVRLDEGRATSVLRTVVLCDLVDSTALVERLGDQRAADLFRRHDKLARALFQRHGGREIDKTDGFLLIFERPIQAVAFALDYQRELADLEKQEGAALAARIGIHVGDVVVWDNAEDDIRRGAKRTEVEGLVKPVAARLMGLALPRQILLSGTAYDIAHRAQGELGERLKQVRWRTHGRYRFKGVPDLVPVFEVGEEGFAPLRAPAWTGKAHREMPVWRRPAAIVGEIFALLLLVAVPLWYFLKPAPAIAFANRDWVVVGDLRNLTGHQTFDNSLGSAFRIGLEQSRFVNVVSDLQVRDSLKRMQRDPATGIDRTIGSEIALRAGARALVVPTVAEIGGRVRVTAEIVDPKTQTSVYSDSVDGAGEASVLPSIDELLRKMRVRLGESMAAIGEASAPLAQITTDKLDALKAYSKAQEAIGAGKIADAIALLQEALREDPAFAMAWTRLGTIQLGYANDAAAASASFAQAGAHRDRLSSREQLYLDAMVARFGNVQGMIDRWTAATQLYPDELTGSQNLGLVLMWYEHRLADASPYFEVLARSGHPQRGYAWYALGLIQAETGDLDKAVASIAEGRKLGTMAPHFEDVSPDLARRDYAAVQARLDGMPAALPASLAAEKRVRVAAVAIDQGKLDVAASALAEATDLANKTSKAQQARTELASVALAMYDGEVDAGKRLATLIAHEVQRVGEAGVPTDGSAAVHLALAAMLAARAHEPELARRALQASRSNALENGYYDRSSLWRTADCETRAVPAERVTCLSSLVDGREYTQTHVALQLAFAAAGDSAAADKQRQWLQAHRGQAVSELENQPALILNLLALRAGSTPASAQ